MAHIIILSQWKGRIIQLDGYAETIHNGIHNEEYKEDRLAQANALMASIETSVSADLNAVDIDNVIGEIETFLGI